MSLNRFVSVTLLIAMSCSACGTAPLAGNGLDYRTEMRQFVVRIAERAREVRPSFKIIPQNGHELLLSDAQSAQSVSQYLNAIDGIAQEDLYYGVELDRATPEATRDYLKTLLRLAADRDKTVLAVDYAAAAQNVDRVVSGNRADGFVPFVANTLSLDTIPPLPADLRHEGDVRQLSDARNFMALLNPGRFDTREDYLDALRGTDHDLLVIDLFYGADALTASEVTSLKQKASGGQRLVICYMSIGEAEDYRHYWQVDWAANPPAWLDAVNPLWPGNYKVRYWNPEWQQVILGETGYLGPILDAGFDGVYLDIIDAFEYFESTR